MAFNAQRARKVAHRQIVRLGGRKGAIKRDGDFTPIMIAVINYSVNDRRGQLLDPLARHALVSTYQPDGKEMLLELNKETDTIVFFDPDIDYEVVEELRIIDRPTKIDPNGVTVLWDLAVMI